MLGLSRAVGSARTIIKPRCVAYRQPKRHLTSFRGRAARPVPSGSWAFRDLQYFPLDDLYSTEPHPKHHLDVYVSSSEASYPKHPAPVVIFVHGGSWVRGDRQYTKMPLLYDNLGGVFAKHDMVGVVISYRLSPDTQHPEHARDVARAIKWVRGNIKKYGGDPDCIILCGHSAGAHLVATLLCDDPLLAEEGLEDLSGSVKGFIGISGVFNIQRLACNPFGSLLVGPVFKDEGEGLLHASPCHRVARASKDTPLAIEQMPMLLLNAQVDFHLQQDAIELLRLLAGRPTTDVSREAVTVPNTNHISIITSIGNTPQGQPIEDLLTSFVRSVVARRE